MIAVGDDDQNIYAFRGSDSRYLKSLILDDGAQLYEMVENYRSRPNIVALANAFAATIQSRIKTAPIRAVQTELGTVQLVHHIRTNMEQPVVDQVYTTYHGGTACVLTGTNDEALRVMGLLTKRGLRARLIQSNHGFRLYNLAEIRFFLKEIDQRIQSPVIPDTLWEDAADKLKAAYSDSACLGICLNLIGEFALVNRTKYRTDLEEFIKESNYEDFYDDDKETIVVSTIHKAKGREFDTVYILISNMDCTTEAVKRQVYVGLTRAKSALYIHHNNHLFDASQIPDVVLIEDPVDYSEPDEITLQLSHRDVVLDFFKGKSETICKLRSGASLHPNGAYLTGKVKGQTVRVVKCSNACIARIDALEKKGYRLCGAAVRFVLAWCGENDDEETTILLPDLHFKRSEGPASSIENQKTPRTRIGFTPS